MGLGDRYERSHSPAEHVSLTTFVLREDTDHEISVAALGQGSSVDVLNEATAFATLPPDGRPFIANPETKRLYPASLLCVVWLNVPLHQLTCSF